MSLHYFIVNNLFFKSYAFMQPVAQKKPGAEINPPLPVFKRTPYFITTNCFTILLLAPFNFKK